MKKNRLDSNTHYDCVVVGAGIVGAAVFRELAGHGLKTLLIDSHDFCSQTSSASSKMLHGGIRYLENFDFPLVYEALHEKNLWLSKVPHLAQERSFYLPVFQDSLRPLWMVNIGLHLYDFLSSYHNTPHRTCDSLQTTQRLPGIKKDGLVGAGIYYDSVVDDTKLGLELIYDGAAQSQAQAFSYHRLEDVATINNDTLELFIKDTIEKREVNITCKELIFTTGPFTDQLLSQFNCLQWKNKMLPSKGSHLWLKKEKFQFDQSIVLTPKDGRVIFLIPYPDKVLLGTTEVPLSKAEFDIKISQEEINYLLANINEYFPQLQIDHSDILSTFSGIRPLVKEDTNGPLGKVARNHQYFQPRSNIHVMIGGKYTTFRIMGMELSKIILNRFNLNHKESVGLATPRQKSVFTTFPTEAVTKAMIIKSAETEYVRTFEDLVKRRMGIHSKAHWTESISFQDYFASLINELKDHIEINEKIINEFELETS